MKVEYKMNQKIFVTSPHLPDINEYKDYIDQIWNNHQLTNQGPLVTKLEHQLSDYLDVDNFHFLTNGTIALQLALKALDISDGEIITTPFSYVATVSSILWERCTPVFVDIDPETFCIDVDKLEKAVTCKTRAIMPVHVFGYPCDVERIEVIALKHNLKVIYDGAHAFGSKYKSKSLLNYGDITTVSFHATKLFNTVEGGGCIVKDKMISDKLELIKRFGHNIDDYSCLGINGKSSEFHAAMGLCNLKYIDEIIDERKQISKLYDQLLLDKVFRPKVPDDFEYNYAYYPIVLDTEEQLLKVLDSLNKHHIYPRRYFWPSLNKLSYLQDKQQCPVSEDISSRIICLPLYTNLEKLAVKKISELIVDNL